MTALEHSGVCSLEQVYLDEDEQYHEARVYEDEGEGGRLGATAGSRCRIRHRRRRDMAPVRP